MQKQAENLLEEFRQLEENPSSDTTNNNQQGFDYVTPWNILDMSSTTIAEQLTIVDAVSRLNKSKCSKSNKFLGFIKTCFTVRVFDIIYQ